MRGLASKIKASVSHRGLSGCLRQSHVSAAGGTAKVRADWTFVSGVSPVSPYLKLLEDFRRKDRERQGEALIGALPRVLGQVGQVQRYQGFKVRQQG
jgi:hypothetical protein